MFFHNLRKRYICFCSLAKRHRNICLQCIFKLSYFLFQILFILTQLQFQFIIDGRRVIIQSSKKSGVYFYTEHDQKIEHYAEIFLFFKNKRNIMRKRIMETVRVVIEMKKCCIL